MQNILIIEDHDDAQRAMIDILNEAFNSPIIDVVSTVKEALLKIENGPYDLVVLDLGLPDGKGEDLIESIYKAMPNAYVVISTIHDESDRLLTALKNGAKGYLLKEQPKELLVQEFQAISKGKPPLAPAITRRILEFVRKEIESTAQSETTKRLPSSEAEIEYDVEQAEQLTDREREILGLMAKGFNRPEIAGILGISKHTVATHIGKIYNKLDITSRSEAALVARHMDLL